MHKMLSAILGLLGAIADQKKLVGSWLILLTVGVGQIGEKVYVSRTREMAVVETQLQTVLEQLRRMDAKLDSNGDRLNGIIVEQARVRAELALQRDITAAQLDMVRKQDERIERNLEKHMKGE